MYDTLPPKVLRLIEGTAVAGLGFVLLFLTIHAQAATTPSPALLSDSTSSSSSSPTSPAVPDSPWAPRPLRLNSAPGKLPQIHAWISADNAQALPTRTRDLIDATLGSCDGYTAQPGVRSIHPCGDSYDSHGSRIFDKQGRPVAEKPNFPGPGDAILFHIVSSNSNRPALPTRLKRLSDSSVRSLAGSQAAHRVYLIYPAQRPTFNTMLVSGVEQSAGQPSQSAPSKSSAQNSDSTPAAALPATPSHFWSLHAFTRPAVALMNFHWRKQQPLVTAAAKPTPPSAPTPNLVVKPALTPYQPAAGNYQQLFSVKSLDYDASSLFLPMPRVSSFLSTVARVAGMSAEYTKSSSTGLILAGDGSAYEPYYTTWATAGHTAGHTRLYAGLVTETMMIVHRNSMDMNWGSTYGVGGGLQFLFNTRRN
jgi:hypothetical protein